MLYLLISEGTTPDRRAITHDPQPPPPCRDRFSHQPAVPFGRPRSTACVGLEYLGTSPFPPLRPCGTRRAGSGVTLPRARRA